eukprot:11962635-Alexandrium_andersonii.AAC.1
MAGLRATCSRGVVGIVGRRWRFAPPALRAATEGWPPRRLATWPGANHAGRAPQSSSARKQLGPGI